MLQYNHRDLPRRVNKLGSGLIAQGPVLLIHFSGSSPTAAKYIYLYDGIDTSGTARHYAVLPSDHHIVEPMNGGMVFERGLYIDSEAATVRCSFIFYPLYSTPYDENDSPG